MQVRVYASLSFEKPLVFTTIQVCIMSLISCRASAGCGDFQDISTRVMNQQADTYLL